MNRFITWLKSLFPTLTPTPQKLREAQELLEIVRGTDHFDY